MDSFKTGSAAAPTTPVKLATAASDNPLTEPAHLSPLMKVDPPQTESPTTPSRDLEAAAASTETTAEAVMPRAEVHLENVAPPAQMTAIEPSPPTSPPDETALVESSPLSSLPADSPIAESENVSPSKKRKADDDLGGNDEEAVTKKQKVDAETTTKERQRKKPFERSKATRPIARSYQECEDYDKKLIDMYAAGKAWPAIRNAWKEITGEKTASSTLPNRYTRLMNNFTIIPDNDKVALIVAKQKIEKEFDASKWSKIAAEMQAQGGEGAMLYKPDVLERQHKKMMLDAEKLPAVGSTMKTTARVEMADDDQTLAGDE